MRSHDQARLNGKKKMVLSMVFLAALSGPIVLAQDLTGTWQGTLSLPGANRDLRIVYKISRANDESLKAVMYSIDQGGQPLPIGAITLQGSTVKMTVPGIGGTYEGNLSGDGNAIKGTWTQGPIHLPLNLTRATTETAWAIPEPPPPLKFMAPDADPVFEVQ